MAEQTNDGFKPVYINRLKTPVGRVGWPKLDKPDSTGQFADNKYKAYLIFDDDADLRQLKKACLDCAKETWPGEDMKKLQFPFHKGDPDNPSDVKKGEWFLGRTFINCKSKNKPLQVGSNSRPLENGIVIRGGYWCRFAVNAMSYMSSERVRQPNGKVVTQTIKGVTFLLEAVQLVREDETFGGAGGMTTNAAADFFDDGEIDDEVEKYDLSEENDPANYGEDPANYDEDPDDGEESGADPDDLDALM